MTLIGQVLDGKIVLDVLVPFPNGTKVRVETVNEVSPSGANPLVGLLADDPQLADQILESAMIARETRPLRTDRG